MKRSLNGSAKLSNTSVSVLRKNVCLLRAVNVSGHNVIKKDQLKLAFESAGFSNVVTYIQSGNIVFESSISANKNDIIVSLVRELKQYLANDIDILVFDIDEWRGVVMNAPFVREVPSTKTGGKGVKVVKTEYISFLCAGRHNLIHSNCNNDNVDITVSNKLSEAVNSLTTQVKSIQADKAEDYCVICDDIAYVPVVYTFAHQGLLEGKFLKKGFVEKYAKMNATARNYDTVLALLDICEAI